MQNNGTCGYVFCGTGTRAAVEYECMGSKRGCSLGPVHCPVPKIHSITNNPITNRMRYIRAKLVPKTITSFTP